MNFQKIVDWFLPKQDGFFILLETQGKILHRAAMTLSSFSNPKISTEETSLAIQEIEHEGDVLVQKVEEDLAATFVTPLDREDIHKLSTEIDDVIDFCNSAARVCVLYGVDRPTAPMIELVRILVECATEIHMVMPSLRSKEYSKFIETKRNIKKLEKEADEVYRSAVGKLFHSEGLEYKTFISQKSVLEKLESAIDRCDDIACVLANVAIKHG